MPNNFKDNGYSSLALKRQRQAAAARRRNGTPRRQNGTPRSLTRKSGTPGNLYCRNSRTPRSLIKRSPRNHRFTNCGTPKTPKMPVTLSHLRTGPLGHLVSPRGRRCHKTPRLTIPLARPRQGVSTDSEDSICFRLCEELLEEPRESSPHLSGKVWSSPTPSPTGTERRMFTHACSTRGATLTCCTFYNRDGSVSPCKMCSAPATPSWTGGPSSWSYPG
jgi:hypothetical protein